MVCDRFTRSPFGDRAPDLWLEGSDIIYAAAHSDLHVAGPTGSSPYSQNDDVESLQSEEVVFP
jgi:hypothetical protein